MPVRTFLPAILDCEIDIVDITIDTRSLVIGFLSITGIALLIALVLIAWLFFKIKRIRLLPDADAFDALRAAPLSVVIVLDLLDFALDIFSAPISWFFLDRLGLKPLRGAAVIKDLIPFTEFVPAMTIGWVVVRLYDRYRLSSGKGLARLPRLKDLRLRRPS